MGSNPPIQCLIKTPVFLEVGPYKSDLRSGCCIVDVTFPNLFYVEIGEIRFKNYYTGYISIESKCKDSNSKWQMLLRRLQLMPDVHCEEGCEDYFTVTPDLLGGIIRHVTAIRFVLQQPSPVWKEFRIEEIAFYKQSNKIPQEVQLNLDIDELQNDLKDEEMKLKGVKSVSEVTKGLQNLWSLTQFAATHKTPPSIGRYDVDGIYQINLLSYS